GPGAEKQFPMPRYFLPFKLAARRSGAVYSRYWSFFMTKSMLLKYRRFLNVGFHTLLIGLANYLAFWIRFDGVIPDQEIALFIQMIPWLVLIRGIIFIPLRLYQGL